MLGEAATVTVGQHAAGVGLAAVAGVTWTLMQRIVDGLRDVQKRSRWASNARDGVALGGVALLAGSYALCGVPLPAAILFSGTFGIVLEVLRRLSVAVRQPLLATALLVSLAVAVWPGPAMAGSNAIAGWLFSIGSTRGPITVSAGR